MNRQMKQRIDDTLAHLNDQQLAQVLDFAEFLKLKQRRANSTPADGVEQTLDEWSGAADTTAYRDL